MFLEDFVSLIGMILIGFFLFFSGLNMWLGATKWYQLQAETQFVAEAIAQQGGYTTTIDSNFRDFLRTTNFDPGDLTINVSPIADSADPALYGTEVTVKMSYPFHLEAWGPQEIVVLPLDTYASSMSTYEPNAQPGYQDIQETYTQPQFGGGGEI